MAKRWKLERSDSSISEYHVPPPWETESRDLGLFRAVMFWGNVWMFLSLLRRFGSGNGICSLKSPAWLLKSPASKNWFHRFHVGHVGQPNFTHFYPRDPEGFLAFSDWTYVPPDFGYIVWIGLEHMQFIVYMIGYLNSNVVYIFQHNHTALLVLKVILIFHHDISRLVLGDLLPGQHSRKIKDHHPAK